MRGDPSSREGNRSGEGGSLSPLCVLFHPHGWNIRVGTQEVLSKCWSFGSKAVSVIAMGANSAPTTASQMLSLALEPIDPAL